MAIVARAVNYTNFRAIVLYARPLGFAGGSMHVAAAVGGSGGRAASRSLRLVALERLARETGCSRLPGRLYMLLKTVHFPAEVFQQ